ncbi:MAG: YeeE/YedE family protein [Geminicoccaceae bacterium]
MHPDNPAIWAVAAGMTLGAATGFLLERSRYCTMGALTDVFLFSSWRRLRVWMVAIAVTTAALSCLASLGILDPARSAPVAGNAGIPLSILGGLLFGIGMVLAGGCASRSLVRLGSGSLKSLLVILLMMVFASAVIAGPFADLLQPAAPWRPDPVIPDTIPARVIVALVALLFLAACAWRQIRRGERRELWLGLALGAVCTAAWSLSGGLFEREAPRSVDFLVPGVDLFLALTSGELAHGGRPPAVFSTSLVAGAMFGAFASSLAGGSFAIETFSDAGDMKRHVCGGVAMGIGGGLAFGCTFGQGIGGLSTLAPGPVLIVLGVVLGARIGLLHLEGRLRWPPAAS